jgi:hypothetical protein
MMKLSRIAAIAATVLAAGSAFAAPIALKPGPLYVQFNNLEQAGNINTTGFTDGLNLGKLDGVTQTLGGGYNEFNWGIFNVSSIQKGNVATDHQDISGGTVYFADGLSGGQVHGIFYGFKLGSDATKLTGGYIDLYWTDGQTIDATEVLNGTGAATASNRTDWNKFGAFTNGTLLARLGYQPGILTGDNNTTVSSDQNPLALTGKGSADGFASIMDVNGDGVWASVLDSNWFYTDPTGTGAVETRDLRFSTFYNGLASWSDPASGVQGLRSNDPARAYVLPEPGSVALVGLSLLGLGIARRRRG